MTTALSPAQTQRAGLSMSAMSTALPQACAVRLIDRRTGQTHRINGSPLVLFTRNPAEAVAELLSGRDAAVWEARIEPIGIAGITPDSRRREGRL
ncbi:hypothetical protein [Paragemmobacter ruber]|uniref:Uncharacterized protein n=1 Tax=Paragemmobacter ruber TaxID=1985673 RepID=A0ABW9Y730_9RHOB|nr:hypothetical protein [Rhodobacter ruber]NBE08320.1 hypothetical protein [Rhodobacter ruber]